MSIVCKNVSQECMHTLKESQLVQKGSKTILEKYVQMKWAGRFNGAHFKNYFCLFVACIQAASSFSSYS